MADNQASAEAPQQKEAQSAEEDASSIQRKSSAEQLDSAPHEAAEGIAPEQSDAPK